jgi:hypothetical protein
MELKMSHPLDMTPGNVALLLKGMKWQTRRLRNPRSTKPPAQPGDSIWIRERHRLRIGNAFSRLIICEYVDRRTKRVVLTETEWKHLTARTKPIGGFTAPRFMFKSCARLRLRLESLRLERLHEITDLGALAEGIDINRPLQSLANICAQFPKLDVFTALQHESLAGSYARVPYSVTNSESGKICSVTPRTVYAMLWEALHGPGSWAKNPWVWVYTLERERTT